MNPDFWQGKKVFLTGHTGFKGSWLSLILGRLGARVVGYSIDIPTQPALFEVCKLKQSVKTIWGDVCDAEKLRDALARNKSDVVIHMAAQPLVRKSYANPAETYRTNVLGTANLLEAVRQTDGGRAVLVVTTDKVYANRERHAGYREHESLGGNDPYSNSKACAELVAQAYQRRAPFGVATARAGNVIGGGDWAADRLVPDVLRAFSSKKTLVVRYPRAVRPWQHVLDPLRGYLTLIEKLWQNKAKFSDAWNFGPRSEDCREVRQVVDHLIRRWGKPLRWRIEKTAQPHEAGLLRLNCAKAKKHIGWTPRWRLEKALDKTVEWARAHKAGKDMRQVTLLQIENFMAELR